MKTLLVKDMKYIAIPVSVLLFIDALVLTAPLSSDAMKNLIILFWLPVIEIYGLFSNEYNSGWNKYVKSLPLSEKEIVGEKFINRIDTNYHAFLWKYPSYSRVKHFGIF